MAKFRSIQTSFWSDSKIVDDFTTEDRYFYLYLLTNEKSNQLGCYEISKNQMCRDTGYNLETVEKLLKRFEELHDVIMYDNETKEIFIKNWHKYNWLNSWKTKVCIKKEFDAIKSQQIIDELWTLYGPYMDLASKNNKNNNNNNNKKKNKNKNNNNNKKDILSSKLDHTPSVFKEVINCFNKIGLIEDNFTKNKMEFHFKDTKANQDLIQKVLDKGYTKENIFDVIFLKYDQWIENNDKNKTDMSTYYRPSTILGEKFDEYYQEARMKGIS
jgi:uncharacterized phage protein (TIGR02220 family)